MTLQERSDKILYILKKMYPEVKTQLHHRTPFELLVATILSAQCTDKQVNAVTPKLFEHFDTPEAFAEASIKTIESLIYSTGFYRNKAKNIKLCAQALLEKHEGTVPRSLEELVALPGVGRKTANVVLGAAFGIPGMVVDTHVSRISQRLGLSRNRTPEKIERDLMELIPEKDWNDYSLFLIYFGRSICKAGKPDCAECPMNTLCDYYADQSRTPKKTRKRS